MDQQTIEEGKLDRRSSLRYFPAVITAVNLEIAFEKIEHKNTQRNYSS
jgi:hypothetical protein